MMIYFDKILRILSEADIQSSDGIMI